MNYDRTVLSYFWHKMNLKYSMGLSREAASGVNRVSYFVAVNVAQIPIILITPLVYLSLLYPLVSPRGMYKYMHTDLVIVHAANNGAVQSKMRRQLV